MTQLEELKQGYIVDINLRQKNQIIEKNNADLLIKLINNADSAEEASAIAMLGTSYNKTGLVFNVHLEENNNKIKYLQRNSQLSFTTDPNAKTHKLIIGDNYPALLNLLTSYKEKIDIIYIDPPYGKDSTGKAAKTNYQNSISRDNLLSMLYPRLKLAKELLSENGVIFCSIDDNNQAYVKCLFDELFGEENHLGTIIQNKGNAQNDANNIQKNHEYILCFTKKKQYINDKEQPILIQTNKEQIKVLYDNDGKAYIKGSNIVSGQKNSDLNHHSLCGYSIYYNNKTEDIIPLMDYDVEKAKILNDENEVYFEPNKELIKKGYVLIRPPKKNGKLGRWTWSFEKFNKEKNLIGISKSKKSYSVYKKQYIDEKDIIKINNIDYFEKTTFSNSRSIIDYSSSNGTSALTDIFDEKVFDNPKNVEMIKYLISLHINKNAIVLDFFAGSGTTGQAVLELNQEDDGNRTFILCTNNEVTDINPNGIAYDVTSKRLKRTMTGECYNGTTDFKWLEKHSPLGDNLEVLDIIEIEKITT